MNWRERRDFRRTRIDLGYTWGSIRDALLEIKAESGACRRADVPDLAADVQYRIAAANGPAMRSAMAGPSPVGEDWDSFFEALIAFIERLIPLISQIIDLFVDE